MSERGFTLIELLAVMSIIALLAALLVPRLAGAATERPEVSDARLIAALARVATDAKRTGEPKTADLAVLTPGARWKPGYPAMSEGPRFFGDGSAYGGDIIRAGRPTIRINWLTGAMERLDER